MERVCVYGPENAMNDTLTAEDFETLRDLPFVLRGEAGALEVELKEVRRLGGRSPRAMPFAVVVRERAARRVFPQGLYRVGIAKGRDVDVFFVPIGPDADGMCYEAVFN